MSGVWFEKRLRHRLVSAALAVILTVTPPGVGLSVAQATEGSDVATYSEMMKASVDSLRARSTNVIQATFENVKKGVPSRMACVDKWKLLMLMQTLTGSFSSMIGAVVSAIINKIIDMALSYACRVLDSYWSQAVSAIEGVGAGVTLPGGAGTVNVGLAVGANGISLETHGNVYGVSASKQLSAPSQGNEPNNSLFEQGKNWVGTGIDRVKSWYK